MKKKIPYIKILPLLIISFICYKIIDNPKALLKGLKYLYSMLLPFIWAFAIAYFLNPLMRYFENKWKWKRYLSLIAVYAIFIGVIAFTIGIMAPKMVENVKQIVKEMPQYAEQTEKFINDKLPKFQKSSDTGINAQLQKNVNSFAEKAANFINEKLKAFATKLISFTSGFVKFIIGLLISIYMLKDKEKFTEGTKRIIRASFGEEKAKGIFAFGAEADKIFSRYIVGKFIDSSIIGAMCFVGLSIIKAPYTAIISMVVGITNMIPYFGPFIGMVFGVIIVIFSSPIMALWVFIFIFLLQQFDGWYLGPKILGDMVGLNPVWIILAVILGGGLFGVAGMFLGVPVIAIIKIWIDRRVEKKLNKNKNDKSCEAIK